MPQPEELVQPFLEENNVNDAVQQPNRTSFSTNFVGDMRTRAKNFQSHIMNQIKGLNISRESHLEITSFLCLLLVGCINS
jgi:hypothetical protein